MTKLKDLEWFCPQPFINTLIYRIVAPMPCCVMKKWPKEKIKQKYGTTDPKELHNTEEYANFRNEFLNGGGPLTQKHCQICIEQEKHSTESHRKIYLDKFTHKDGEYGEHFEALEKYINTDMSEPYFLTMEYVAPSNFCNLRCNMCGPYNSSSLAQENKNIGLDNAYGMDKFRNKPALIKEKDNVEEYADILKNLTELKLVGGETLAIKENYDLIQLAVDLDVSKNMSLRITTNGTLTPKFGGKDIFDYIPHFKDCQMTVSIEFWGEKNDYLRFPSKWNVIIENARKFVECPRTRVMFATTVNALTLGYLPEIAVGVYELRKEYESRKDALWSWASGSLVWGDGNQYAITSIPLDIREMYMNKYFEYSDFVENEFKEWEKLYSYLKNMPFDEELHKEMMTDIQLRDNHRGTCLTDVFPEWKPYYEKL
tara:strand:+ start:90 stop:1370 length:1281 start_codon:yes stop_codon:yes gene_type:complete